MSIFTKYLIKEIMSILYISKNSEQRKEDVIPNPFIKTGIGLMPTLMGQSERKKYDRAVNTHECKCKSLKQNIGKRNPETGKEKHAS